MMVILAVCLLVIGTGLLFAEALIPGFGVLGISGIIVIIISSVITIASVPFGIFVVAGEILALSAAMLGLMKYLKKKQLYGKLVLNDTLRHEENDIDGLHYFMGKEGITKTSLRPFGTADFDGVIIEVCSDGSYVDAKQPVVVTDVRQQRIIVRPSSKGLKN